MGRTVDSPGRHAALPARAGAGLRHGVRRWGVPLRAFAVFILLWHVASLWYERPLQLPSPDRVAAALRDLAESGDLADHALTSTRRMLTALGLATIVAVPLGILMGLQRGFERLVNPLVELLRPISGIAWLPLALWMFGIGDTLPVFIMFYVAVFPILFNTIAGVRQVDPRLIAASRTMGVGRRNVLFRVVLPSAMPSIVVGLRLAFAGSWAAIVAAELIGAPSGLGFAIEWYRQMLMTPKVFAIILTIGLIGYLGDLLLRLLQRRLTPWATGGEL